MLLGKPLSGASSAEALGRRTRTAEEVKISAAGTNVSGMSTEELPNISDVAGAQRHSAGAKSSPSSFV